MILKAKRHVTDQEERQTAVRKLKPAVLMPPVSVLRALSAEDLEILRRRLSEPTECVYHAKFATIGRTALAAAIERPVTRRPGPPLPDGAPDVFTADEEREIFFRFNLYRYRVMKILRAYRGKRLDARTVRELLRWERAAVAAREEIVRANTSLVLAMARRSKNITVELSELVSEGNLALLRCVDKFDFARGFKFSTYACRAILASFSRASVKASRYRLQFPATYDPALEKSNHVEVTRARIEEECVADLKTILLRNAADLSTVERRVLDARFALDLPTTGNLDEPRPRGKTLEQVGDLLGVSKERVRQIQNQALDKLRAVLENELAAAS